MENSEAAKLTAQIVSAYVSHNPVQASEMQDIIKDTHASIVSVATGADAEAERQEPAVPIKKSVMPDHIICLEDGKKLKMLKRYLRSRYNVTPDEYRTKWGLAHDYPMVAPNYAAKRSEFAKKIGLGRPAAAAKSSRRAA